MSNLRPEDVKEALELWDDTIGPNESVLPMSTQIIVAAARAWLDPDYDAAYAAKHATLRQRIDTALRREGDD